MMLLDRLIAAAGLSLAITIFLGFGFVYIGSHSISVAGQEQNVIFGIQTLLSGASLYRLPDELPFAATQYTPLYYRLCALLARALGLHPGDLHELYSAARLVSAVASAATCAVVFRILSQIAGAGLVIRLTLALSVPAIMGPWAFAARPDALYLFFVVASIPPALAFADNGRPRTLAFAAALLLAGFFAKQTAFFMFPLPLLIASARNGRAAFRPRNLLVCAAVYGTGALFLTPAMLRNFAVGLGNGLDLEGALAFVYLAVLIRDMPWLLAAALAARAGAGDPDWRGRAVGRATLWFLAAGGILAAKYGSSDNYLDEFRAGLLLLVGTAPSLAIRARGTPAARLLMVLTVAGQLSAVWSGLPTLKGAESPIQDIFESGRTLAAAPELTGQRAIVLDLLSLIFIPEQAVLAPAEVMGSAAAAGQFDVAKVQDAVRSGAICFLVTDDSMLSFILRDKESRAMRDLWPKAAGLPLLGDFHPGRRIGRTTLYRSNYCPDGG
jgi:hypothetical protein